MSTVPVADAGACYGGTDGSPIDGVCQILRDHVGSQSGWAITIVSRIAWPLVIGIIVLLVARIARRILVRGFERSQADAQVRTLLDNVILFTGIVVATGAALVTAGVNVSVFVTVGGLSTLVIGLAFQDLLRNVLAGMVILLERPFRIGDAISVNDLTGIVLTIELRTTQIRLFDGRLAVIPNLDVFTKTVISLTAFEQRQFSVSLWLPMGTNLERILPALRAELMATTGISENPAPVVIPEVNLDGGVTIRLLYWLEYRRTDPDVVATTLVRRVYAEAERVAGRSAEQVREHLVSEPTVRVTETAEPATLEDDTLGWTATCFARARLWLRRVTGAAIRSGKGTADD